VVSASSFIVPYLHFQKERESSLRTDSHARSGYFNLAFFLGVGVTSFVVWVVGTGVGYRVALGFPPGFEETLKFILPGYFAGLLVVEMKGWRRRSFVWAASSWRFPARGSVPDGVGSRQRP
jgi:predicted branched-subunit amino acid permease